MFQKRRFLALLAVSSFAMIACGTNGSDTDLETSMPPVEEQETTASEETEETSTTDTTAEETTNQPSADAYADISLQPEEAFDLYREQYPNAEITQIHLDRENGIYVYEVEGFEGTMEYELKIHAVDGTILKEDTDTDDDTDDRPVTREQVARVKAFVDQALTDAGTGATLDEWTLDMDDGIAKLEIDLDKQDGEDEEHTYNVDTGELLEIDN